MHFDWSQVNTALLLGAFAYLWKQARAVDSVRQALVGTEGETGGGALGEIKLLRSRFHDLSNAMAELTGSLHLLTSEVQAIKMRRGNG